MEMAGLEDEHGDSFNKKFSRRKEKAKRPGINPGDRRVLKQQASSGKRSATDAVKTQLKTGSSSNTRVRYGLDERRSNPQGFRLIKAQAKKWSDHPLPRRGDVTKGIIKGAVGSAASACGFCCSSPTSTSDEVEVDTFLKEAPFPTKNQPMATIWADVAA